MSTTYLQLVNDCNARVNEVPLTSANFATATGHYSVAKQAVNDSIRRLGQEAFEWPFFHTTKDKTLVAGDVRVAYETDCKTVDFDSFRIQRDATFGNDTKYLQKINYEEYLKFMGDAEYNTSDTGIRSIPRYVFQDQARQFGIYPPPDNAYTLTYEYFKYPTELTLYSSTMEFPDDFRHVVVDYAMYDLYLFRSDYEAADRVLTRARAGLKTLRTIHVNRYDHVYDTRVGFRRSDNL